MKLYATDSERVLIGGFLMRPDALVENRKDLLPEYFGSEKYQIIYRTMLKILDNGDALEPSVLINELHELPDAMGLVTEIIDEVATSAGIPYHIKELKKYDTKRKYAVLGDNIHTYLENDQTNEDIDALIKKTVLNMHPESKIKVISLKDALPEVINELEILSKSSGALTGITSGFSKIDWYTSGWQPGDFIIVAGRPGMGKSIFAKNMAEAAGVPVGYFTLEMSYNQLVKRHLSDASRVEFELVRTGRLRDLAWEGIIHGANKLGELDITMFDGCDVSIDELISEAENIKIKKDIKLLIIDYLQLIKSVDRNREQEVSSISRRLKALARNLDIPVICLAQLNRQCEMRGKDKRPMLSDLRESGSLEQDADIVAFLYREYMYNNQANKHDADLILAKGRNIRTGIIKLFFDGKYQTFRNYHEGQ